MSILSNPSGALSVMGKKPAAFGPSQAQASSAQAFTFMVTSSNSPLFEVRVNDENRQTIFGDSGTFELGTVENGDKISIWSESPDTIITSWNIDGFTAVSEPDAFFTPELLPNHEGAWTDITVTGPVLLQVDATST